MSRPTPLKSSLAGSTPVTPVPAATPAAPTPAPVMATAANGAGTPEPGTRAPELKNSTPTPAASSAPTGTPTSKYPPKVSFYQDPQDTARMRGALLHTLVTEGPRTLSQFIHQAVMAEVERLEAVYNDGQPFPAVAPRKLPQGRPMGE